MTAVMSRVAAPEAGIGNVLFESSPDCVKLLDPAGCLVDMNRNGQCLMEIDDFQDLSGRTWASLWPDENREEIQASVQAALSGRTGRFQAFCPTAKGTPKWWDVTVTPVVDGAGRVTSLLSVSRDITELQRAQDEQRETAAHLRFILESSRIGTWQIDLQTGATRTSLLHDQCFGYTKPVAGWSRERFMEHVHPLDRDAVSAAFERALDGRRDLEFECRVIRVDGSVHWIEVQGSFYTDSEGAALRLLGTVVDTTQRRQDQEALVESNRRAIRHAEEADAERARLDALLEAAPVGIIYVGPDGQLLSANAATHEIWGEHPAPSAVDEYVQWKGWWADGSERHGEPLQPRDWPIGRLLDGRESSVTRDIVEIEPFDAPGMRKTTLLQADLVRDREGSVIGGVVVQVDISEQVRAQVALQESEARFRTITNAVPQMIWSTRQDGSSDYFNRQWYEFSGTPEGSSDGFGWVELVHPEDRAAAAAAWDASTAAGIPYEIEYRLRHHADGYRWVLARGLPVLDAHGRVERWMGTCTDVHERKTFESALEHSEQALRQADRRKDEFLAMLAHELRNPLAPIGTATQIIKRAQHDPERVGQAADVIERQVRHLTGLVDDLLDVSRVTRGLVDIERVPVDLHSVVAAALEQVQPLLHGRNHELRTRWSAGDFYIQGDFNRLVQVLANLLTNAAKYTPVNGCIDLQIRRDGSEVTLSVSDNGVGIAPDVLPGVFELFAQAQRTPDRAQGGLGIGLALVKDLVKLHGGRIEAASAGLNCGSTFTVRLPLTSKPAGSSRTSVVGSTPVGGRKVLVVDDNVDAGSTLADLLRVMGHDVDVAANGASAEQVAADGDHDVYILDIGLPDVTGFELAQRLRAAGVRPGAMFIALTGYGQPHDLAMSQAAGFEHHMVKPPDISKLLHILDQR